MKRLSAPKYVTVQFSYSSSSLQITWLKIFLLEIKLPVGKSVQVNWESVVRFVGKGKSSAKLRFLGIARKGLKY